MKEKKLRHAREKKVSKCEKERKKERKKDK